MENFLSYLKNAQKALKCICSVKDIHIVMGNEACDLDSTVSALMYGYLLSKKYNENVPVIPVMNVLSDHFLLRLESCFALKQCGIDTNLFNYRPDINFEEIKKNTIVKTTIVDHHVLSKNDEILRDTIIEIFDHRPLDPTAVWDEKKIKINISQVGSCSSLICDEILNSNPEILTKELAYLLYETIIYDTLGLVEGNGKTKDLDIAVTKALENKFNFTEDKKAIFNRLWKEHSNVSSLNAKQLLYKDLKIVEGVPVPGLPMLVHEYLIKYESAYEALLNMANEYNSPLLIVVGKNSEIKRDFGILSTDDDYKNFVINMFKNSENTKGYNFDLPDEFINTKKLTVIRQNNTLLSRKQIIPIVKDAVIEYKSLR